MRPGTIRVLSLCTATCLALVPWGCDCGSTSLPQGTQDGSGNGTLDATRADLFGVDTLGMDLALPDTGHPDGSVNPSDSGVNDHFGEDVDPLVVPLPDFCAGSGAVVNFGDQGVCAGDLAAQTFRFAICACENITVGSQITTDSFDSSQGPYGGSNVGEDGNLGMNLGPLALSNKITVQGSGYIGGGGMTFGPSSMISQNLTTFGPISMAGGSSAIIGRNAFINGDLGNRITVQGDLFLPAAASVDGTVNGTTTRRDIPAVLPCPCAANQVLNIAGLTNWASTNNDNAVFAAVEDGGTTGLDPTSYASGGPGTLRLPCGRFYLTEINQDGPLNIVVSERSVLFVDGNMSTSRFDITIEPGGELDLFVAGDVTITASASFGSADSPASVRSYIGGNVNLQASAGFAGNVYAPNADIVFGASATVYGSLFVRNVTFSASGTVHFDSAIRRAGDSCVEPTDAGVTTPDAAGTDTARPDAFGQDTWAPDTATAPDAARPDRTGTDATEAYECHNICDFACGLEACLIEDGAAGGFCGPCGSDLDCCAPLLCNPDNGQCFYAGG